jgi:DNA polymerase-3 subunit gamma/tau
MTVMAKRKAKTPDEAAPAPPTAGYTVLARRYRPQQFGDLVGQEAVAQALANAIASGRVAHAYLFTGARGVGKTSAARILAKALNCAQGPTTTPCGQCEMCQAIAVGEDVDVLEIDGASNRGIDEIREIRQNVHFRPARGRYKIYIIDEVHMLSRDAFNALLKTLEEPPPHVKFIFATTEVQKIPLTILSRCQRFDFGGIRLPRIVERLKQIVAGEGMQADDEALQLVARRAGGSMRDAQSLLDQLLAFSGDRLTTGTIHKLLGTANEERIATLAAAVLQRDAKQALALLAAQVEEGQQLGELLDQLIEYWRDLMVVHCAGAEGQELSVSGGHRETLEGHAKALSLDTILAGMDVLVAAKNRLRGTSHARVILEMTLVRLAELEQLVPLTQLVQWVKDGTAASPPQANATSSRAVPARSEIEKKKPAPAGEPVSGASALVFSEENCTEMWRQVVEQAGFALRSDLRKVQSVAIFGPNALEMRVFAGYNGTGPGGIDPARLTAAIEPVLRRIVGQPCTVRVAWVEGGENGQKPVAADNAGAARQLREKVRQLPLVQKARAVLDAEILFVEDEFGAAAVAPAGTDESAEAGAANASAEEE